MSDSEREPDEIRVCKEHYVSFSGPEPCGICTLREKLRAAERALLDIASCTFSDAGVVREWADAALAEIRRK